MWKMTSPAGTSGCCQLNVTTNNSCSSTHLFVALALERDAFAVLCSWMDLELHALLLLHDLLPLAALAAVLLADVLSCAVTVRAGNAHLADDTGSELVC